MFCLCSVHRCQNIVSGTVIQASGAVYLCIPIYLYICLCCIVSWFSVFVNLYFCICAFGAVVEYPVLGDNWQISRS